MEDKETEEMNPRKQKVHPRAKAGILSKIFFCWTFPFFLKGYKKDLSEEDLYGSLEAHESGLLGDKLEAAWIKEENTRKHPSLWRALTKVFSLEMAGYGFIIVFIECVIKMSQPIFIGKLMDYYTPHQKTISKKKAYVYAGCIVLSSFLCVMFGHWLVFGLQHLGMKIRVACCSLIYRKSLKLSKSALAETNVGQIVNLLSNDVNRFDMVVLHLHQIWVGPIQTLIALYLLYTTTGPASITGVGVFLLIIPFQLYLAKWSSVYRLLTALKTDQRVRLMNEIICGIQVIKMYTWEKPFAKLVELSRKLEMKQIRNTSYIRAVNVSLAMFLTRTGVFFCVLAYVLTGNTLKPQFVFVVTSFYGILRHVLTTLLPLGATTLAETNISVQRIQKFLMSEEVEQENRNKIKINFPQVGIGMDGVCVKRALSAPDYTLENVSLKVGHNELVAIIGRVGSGKSTLLHVILKELSLVKGTLDVEGSISYASQEPWLFGASIKQNILFGQEMDVTRYKKVVRVCALEHDFSLFPYGDRSLIGERGVMLSGGQKARVNLARAIYKNADIYLLDDPLSAVDAHVGRQLFEECILGFLENKCVVLVTHQLQYLGSVDRIYLLANGTLVASGTYPELQGSNEEFLKLLVSESAKEEHNNVNKIKTIEFEKIFEKLDFPREIKEQRSTGTVSSGVYKHYVKAGGSFLASFILTILFLLVQILGGLVDYFLSFWVNLEQKRLESNDQNYKEFIFTSENLVYFYVGLMCFLITLAFIRSFGFFSFSVKASKNLHNCMFARIVYAPMRFFNVNSSGRILNRFSKDMGSIDETLPLMLIETLTIGLGTVSIIIVVGTVNPWILIPSFVIISGFYGLRVIFLATSRDLKRIEGISRSPVFTHMTASLSGLTTIRAFGVQAILKTEFDQLQNLHTSAYYMFRACTQTFGFWLDLNSVIYTTLVTMSFLLFGTESYAGNVGLGITQALTLTGMLQYGMRQWSELENNMTSVERVVEYTELVPELDVHKLPPRSWPSQAVIAFQSVSMRYDVNEPLVLKNVTFQIQSGEKIGIVGRTGSGKSSLVTALFRLATIEGVVLLDGIDTKKISLHSLRSKISIIPQEPVLFSGSLRKNLDPLNEYKDDQLWNALEEVELKTVISDSGLQANVLDGGSNFSVGQRQLLCLARAVVRDNKILVLDEATANVDPQTDELIQTTIRRKFRDCTVLTIAHRLDTVLDSDKILVMEAGEVVEFDHPHHLLKNTIGIFYDLVKQTGQGMADNLRKIAEEKYKKTV